MKYIRSHPNDATAKDNIINRLIEYKELDQVNFIKNMLQKNKVSTTSIKNRICAKHQINNRFSNILLQL